MKKTLCIGLMFMLGCSLPSSAAQPTPHEMKQIFREPLVLDATRSPKMHVVFKHKKHRKVPCLACHHKEKDGFAFVSCASQGCHDDTNRASRKGNSYFLAMHQKKSDRSCLGCHFKRISARHPDLARCQTCHDTQKISKGSGSEKNAS